MIINWIKGFLKPEYYNGSYEYQLDKQKAKADLKNMDARWSNLEFRTFK